MRQSLSVRDVMRRTFVGVSEGDSVTGATKLMNEEGVDGAVVVRGSDPVGVLMASDVVAVVATGMDPETTAVDAAMRQPAVTVAPSDDLGEAIGAIANHNVRWLVVVSEGSLVGTVTEHDIVTAQSSHPPLGTPEPTEAGRRIRDGHPGTPDRRPHTPHRGCVNSAVRCRGRSIHTTGSWCVRTAARCDPAPSVGRKPVCSFRARTS
jgi:CBS domain-containing protein